MKINLMLSATAMSLAMPAFAQDYAADVPENVLTPDVVETQTLGAIVFFDRMPNADTSRRFLTIWT
ncbi:MULTISPECIES: hypothetical protein [Halocynthiibacter]|uniref:Uncharacterized protein n=1 Tax=Halocynthiibacter halioticoli TaxID=2986804 RepID=A0AAE3LRH0_9RHOB|nr:MULTISPECIES: hypothetical protein [Halocynthiibacter]MCV6824563.1 hypothetical protein [Halocynthiibacter halioticoli]MCW4057564.1 hypothetical protein [Halocynthiibacter sp. SDUM655004]